MIQIQCNHCNKPTCILCDRYKNDPRYQDLWFPPEPAAPPTSVEQWYVINLDRRPDRMEQMQKQFDMHKISNVKRITAVDGKLVPIPSTWGNGMAGAYGLQQTVTALLQQALSSRHNVIGIFEDDCLIQCANFNKELTSIIERVNKIDPHWQAIMLGGQHQKDGYLTADTGIHKAVQCHRTHAYILRGNYIREMYETWRDTTTHIDHAWGKRQPQDRVFCVYPFICAQNEGKSDINGRQLKVRDWQPRRVRDFKPCEGCNQNKNRRIR